MRTSHRCWNYFLYFFEGLKKTLFRPPAKVKSFVKSLSLINYDDYKEPSRKLTDEISEMEKKGTKELIFRNKDNWDQTDTETEDFFNRKMNKRVNLIRKEHFSEGRSCKHNISEHSLLHGRHKGRVESIRPKPGPRNS